MYSYTVYNARDIPLTYVICKRNCPVNNVIIIDEEIVCNGPLHGLDFNIDGKTVPTLTNY